MNVRILFLFLALIAGAVSAAPAQSGPRPGESGSRSGETTQRHRRSNEAGAVPKLLRHRVDLGLTEGQVERLMTLDRKLEEQNRPYVQQLMKIRHDMQIRPGVKPEDMTEAERVELRSHLEQARPLWSEISKNNHRAMREVGDILNAEQKSQLRELLSKPRERNGSPGPERSRPERD